MKVANATDVKNRLGEYMDNAQQEPVRVMKQNKPYVVIVSTEEYDRLTTDASEPETAMPEVPTTTGREYSAASRDESSPAERALRARKLFAEWAAEDAGLTDAELAEAERDWEELKANINANRAATGERPVL